MSLKQPTPRLNDLLLRGADDLSPELKEQALDDILAEFGSAPTKRASVDGDSIMQNQPTASPTPSGTHMPDAEPAPHFLEEERSVPIQDAAAQQISSSDSSIASMQAAAAPEKPASRSLVIDGIDFSEFLEDAPPAPADSPTASCVSLPGTPERVTPAQPETGAAHSAAPEKSQAASDSAPKNDAAPLSDDTAPRANIRRRAKPGSIVLRILAFAALLATVGFLYTQTIQNRQSSASFDSVCSSVLQTLDLTDMQEADAQMVRRLYGFAPSEMDGCLLYYPATNMGARELLIVKLTDLSQQKAVSDAIQARKQTQMKSFEGYGIEQYDLLSNSVVEVQGNFILFVVHEDASAAAQAFLKAL